MCPILGSVVSLFWITGDVSSGFQNRVGSVLFTFVEVNVMYIP